MGSEIHARCIISSKSIDVNGLMMPFHQRTKRRYTQTLPMLCSQPPYSTSAPVGPGWTAFLTDPIVLSWGLDKDRDPTLKMGVIFHLDESWRPYSRKEIVRGSHRNRGGLAPSGYCWRACQTQRDHVGWIGCSPTP